MKKKLFKGKKILKKTQTMVSIPSYQAPSILGDPNRFFKNEMEEAKKSMFFQ